MTPPSRRRAALPAPLRVLMLAPLLAAVVGVLLSAPPAAAETVIDRAGRALRTDPVYVDPAAGNLVSAEDVTAMREQVRGANPPVYVAVLPRTAREEAGSSGALPRALAQKVGAQGAYIALTPVSLTAASSVASDQVVAVTNEAVTRIRQGQASPAEGLRFVVDRTVAVTSGAQRDAGRAQDPAESQPPARAAARASCCSACSLPAARACSC